MLLVALYVVVGAVLARNHPGNFFQSCDFDQYQRCQNTFNVVLGIDNSIGVKSYQKFRAAIEGKLAIDKAGGLARICLAFNLYKTCFENNDDYSSCAANSLGLLLYQNGTFTGITEDEAFGYTKIINQFDFSCGMGFPEFANNEECAASVFLDGVSDMRVCDRNFIMSLREDVDPKNTCAYVEQAKECYVSAFRKRCSQYPDVVWWGCNYERIGTQTMYPQCSKIFCTHNERRPM